MGGGGAGGVYHASMSEYGKQVLNRPFKVLLHIALDKRVGVGTRQNYNVCESNCQRLFVACRTGCRSRIGPR